MNLKSISASISLVAGSALVLFANPAEAAVLSFGTNGIKFDTDTEVNLTFLSSQGDYQSTFGVVEVSSSGNIGTFTSLFKEIKAYDNFGLDNPGNDFRGTCGGSNSAVANCNATFKFLGGVEYSFALESVALNGTTQPTVYSTTGLNGGLFGQQAKFIEGNPVEVDFEDKPIFDPTVAPFIDYNDFKVSVVIPTEPGEKVPEPATIFGLALAGASMLFTGRKISQSS